MQGAIVRIDTQIQADNRQADNDVQFISLWLRGRRPHTQRAYNTDVTKFMQFTGNKSIHTVTIKDLQDFADTLNVMADASIARCLSSVKSLFAFGQKIGYLQYNVAAVIELPSIKDTLAERILTESEVQSMIALEVKPRNKTLLRFMYSSGARVSEVCGLKWKDCINRDTAGQVTLYGKGGKTRIVLLSEGTWKALAELRGDAAPDAPVFKSQKGGHLTTRQVLDIVKAAAVRAGIEGDVSPHWLRHSHASHALDRKCPIHLVQSTLGHSSVATTGKYLHARPDDSSAKYLGV